MVDATAHRQADEIRRRLIESSQDAIVGKDLDGIIVSWNQAAEQLFGYTADEAIGLPIAILIPPERLAEETIILDRIRSGIKVDHYETIRRRKDGSFIDISLSISPIRDAEGNVIGACKIARDITERKRAEEKSQLVLREINHRVKNLFSVASGMLSVSARSAATPSELAAAVRGRLTAMARAQELILPDLSGDLTSGIKTATFAELARAILSPFEDARAGTKRVQIEGPDVTLGPSAVTNLALLLHEFATNAAKYGALSESSGKVKVAWRATGETLQLDWAERNGPPLTAKAGEATGFGSVLIDRIVCDQLGGKIVRHWKPEGLAIEVGLPLQPLAR
ncbi:PAS domain S-box protein [uncultured Methylovirgula sp.]|uniref:PAS domain S-box protein n=1 Tax=uncultured Methylovirgula sp. TaxID=1285960 RepID=UPI00261E3C52|nr:PAS domain S-box protein [uncultured Methylovirgula sp.]